MAQLLGSRADPKAKTSCGKTVLEVREGKVGGVCSKDTVGVSEYGKMTGFPVYDLHYRGVEQD